MPTKNKTRAIWLKGAVAPLSPQSAGALRISFTARLHLSTILELRTGYHGPCETFMEIDCCVATNLHDKFPPFPPPLPPQKYLVHLGLI